MNVNGEAIYFKANKEVASVKTVIAEDDSSNDEPEVKVTTEENVAVEIPYHYYKTLMLHVEKYGAGQKDVYFAIKANLKDWFALEVSEETLKSILEKDNATDEMNRLLATVDPVMLDDKSGDKLGIYADENTTFVDEYHVIHRAIEQVTNEAEVVQVEEKVIATAELEKELASM